MTREEALGLSNGTSVEIRYVGLGVGRGRQGKVLAVYEDGSAINIHLTAAPWGTMMGVPSTIVHLPHRENQEEAVKTDA